MRNHFLRAKGVTTAAGTGVETAPTVSVNSSLNTDEWTRITQRSHYNVAYYYSAAVDKEGDGSIYKMLRSNAANYKIIKMTQSGAISWQKELSYSGTAEYLIDGGWAIDNNGNLIIVGHYKDGNSTVSGGRCPLIMRVNSNGSIAWAYKFGTGHHSNANYNTGYSVVVNKDNDIFVTGVVRGSSAASNPYITFLFRLTQTNTSASLQWYKKLEDSTTSGYLQPQGLKTISNSEYVYFLSNKNTNAYNISRIKYDASSIHNQYIYRDSAWSQNNSNQQSYDHPDYMHIDANGNFYLLWSYNYMNTAVIKLDKDLDVEWATECSANSSTYEFVASNVYSQKRCGSAIGATDVSGDVCFAFTTIANSTDNFQYPNIYLACLDSSGDLNWDKIITSLTTNGGTTSTQVTTSTNGNHTPFFIDGDTKDNFYLGGFFPGWRNSDSADWQYYSSGGILKHQSDTEPPNGNYISAASGNHVNEGGHSNPPSHWMNISAVSGYTFSSGSWTSSSTSPSGSYGGVELQNFPSNSGTWALTDVSSNVSVADVGTTEQGYTYKDTL